MPKVVWVVGLGAAAVVYLSTGSLYGAIFSGLFWGAVAALYVWARSRWRARREGRLGG